MIPCHEGPLLAVAKAFIVLEAADLLEGYNGVLTEMDVVCYAVRETLSVIPILLVQQFPVCDIETLLKGLLSVLRLDLHSPCAGLLLLTSGL